MGWRSSCRYWDDLEFLYEFAMVVFCLDGLLVEVVVAAAAACVADDVHFPIQRWPSSLSFLFSSPSNNYSD